MHELFTFYNLTYNEHFIINSIYILFVYLPLLNFCFEISAHEISLNCMALVKNLIKCNIGPIT